MKYFPKQFCIVDTETTGLSGFSSRVIEIAILRIENGKVVKRFESLINPGISIPAKITSITGITNDDLLQAPQFEEIALQVQEILHDAIFVAHNVAFDYNFVKQEFNRIGIPYQAPKLCSVVLSRKLYPNERAHNLDAIINRFSIPVDNRHRAMSDALAVLAYFKIISKKINKDIFLETLESCIDNPISKMNSKQLSDGSGIYKFYDQNNELLYIGKSNHIRTRVRSHFSNKKSKKEIRLSSETISIDSHETSGELSALLLEATLIKNESPLYNRMLRRTKKLVVAKKISNDIGYSLVSLSTEQDISPDENIVGVWRSKSAAKKSLDTLSKEYKLCPILLGLESGSKECFNYQLRLCDGACIQKISAKDYNAKVDEAFKKRAIKLWPYKGIVCIKEEKTESSGSAFFINNWVLINAFSYDGQFYEQLNYSLDSFDYDTYKILVKYMLSASNKNSITIVSSEEYTKQLEMMTYTYDDAIQIT